MTREGRAPLDHGLDQAGQTAVAAMIAVERRAGATIGAREMAMTRRPRAEDSAPRTRRFIALARRPEGD